jgi:hypothetical protein
VYLFFENMGWATYILSVGSQTHLVTLLAYIATPKNNAPSVAPLAPLVKDGCHSRQANQMHAQ